MRKGVLLIVMAFAMFVTGCKDDNGKGLADVLVGQWELAEYVPVTKGVMIGNEPVSVTIVFQENQRFILYQKVGEAFTESFEGTWSLEGTTLSGVYSDDKPWGEKYEISFRDSDNTLEMITQTAREKYVYQRYIPKE